MTILAFRRFAVLSLFSLFLAACGSSGGTETPPSPPAPMVPSADTGADLCGALAGVGGDGSESVPRPHAWL